MSKNTRTFSDVDLNFIAHPSTGDIAKKYDEAAIKQSIKNLVLTANYERPFHPEIGSQVRKLLFDPASPLTKNMLDAEISNVIQNFEPRVVLISAESNFDLDNNNVIVNIIFRIINTTRPISIDIILQRTR